MIVPVRLIELWLTLVHGALCRQVAGGLLVHLPANVQLLTEEHTRAIAVRFEGTDQVKLEREASRLFGQDWLSLGVADDIKQTTLEDEPALSLRRALSELQAQFLDGNIELPNDAELLQFFLKTGEYRSRHISVRRVTYHVVPHQEGWKVKRQGQDEGELYSTKEKAVKAGADRAKTSAAGQLIIHAANGTFEEERTYGHDPDDSEG